MARSREIEAPNLPQAFRQALDDYRADFDIGGQGRYLPNPKGTLIVGSNADYHYRLQVPFMRAIERARFYDRNNMIVGQGVNRLAANLVQDGFTLDTLTGDDGVNRDLKAAWYEWCEDPERCDFEGEKSFYEMEVLAARTVPVDGDIFCLPRAEGSLQWMEAHRCRRPQSTRRNCVHGVNINPKTAKRTSYFFTKQDTDPLGMVRNLADVVEVPARDSDGEKLVLHLHWPTRFSQRRGVTAFAPIALPIQFHDDIQFANLVAAQVQSCWAILEEQQTTVTPPPPRTGPEAQTGAVTTDQFDDGKTRTVEGVAPGMRVRAPAGWTMRGFAPTIPGPQFKEHALMILTIIAINLDLPVHVLLLDPSHTNFSGWRGAIEQARIRFRVMQRLLITRFYRPVWRWFVRQQMSEDTKLANAAKRSGINIFGHAWHPPTWQYIEPLKDVQSDVLEAASSQNSRRRQKARRGEDWDDIVPEIAQDNGKLIRAAKKEAAAINKDFPDDEPVSWRDVISLPLPQGVTLSLKADEGNQEDGAAKETRGTNAKGTAA
jgi:lambda family phage portal protein